MKGRAMLGLLLIVLGVFLLLGRFGYLNWVQFLYLLRFWPLVLIAFGVSLLFPRGTWVFAGLLGLLVLAGAAYIMANPDAFMGQWETAELTAGPAMTASSGFRALETRVTFAAGELTVSGGAEHPAELQARYDSRLRDPKLTFTDFGGGRGRVELAFPENSSSWFNWVGVQNRHYRAELRLNESPVHDIRAEFAAGVASFDLADLTVRDINLRMAAGQVRVELGEPNLEAVRLTTVRFNMAAGQFELTVPEDAGVRVEVNSVAGDTNLSGPGWDRKGNAYYSPNYDEAPYRIEVSGEVVAGQFVLRRR